MLAETRCSSHSLAFPRWGFISHVASEHGSTGYGNQPPKVSSSTQALTTTFPRLPLRTPGFWALLLHELISRPERVPWDLEASASLSNERATEGLQGCLSLMRHGLGTPVELSGNSDSVTHDLEPQLLHLPPPIGCGYHLQRPAVKIKENRCGHSTSRLVNVKTF